MYHPGKVLEVFSSKDKNVRSSDASVQAMLEMWDDNILTFTVNPKIAGKIKKKDVVLVDYTPSPKGIPAQKIVKIISGTKGKSLWEEYKLKHNSRKKVRVPQGYQ